MRELQEIWADIAAIDETLAGLYQKRIQLTKEAAETSGRSGGV